VRDVDKVRQVAVLAEELAEGDRDARRPSVRLVRRPENDDDVAAPIRMQRVGPIDVP
jgi:hypothetical protein